MSVSMEACVSKYKCMCVSKYESMCMSERKSEWEVESTT